MTRADAMFCQSWFPVFFAPRLAGPFRLSYVHFSVLTIYAWEVLMRLWQTTASVRFSFFWCVYQSDIVSLFRSIPISLLMVQRNDSIFHNNTFLLLLYLSKLVSQTSSFLVIGNSPLRCRITVRNCRQVRPLLHWGRRSQFSGISEVTSRHPLLGHLKNSLFTKHQAITVFFNR
jgi:hypothetical protein